MTMFHHLPADDGGLFVGAISGTSADGVDVAVVRFSTRDCQLVGSVTGAYPALLREHVLRLSQSDPRITLDELGELDGRIADAFADTINALLGELGLRPSDVRAIGSHGQTLRHNPNAVQPFTLQLGDPSRIAERCGIAVVADFRRRDVAAGGQGAPLVPAFHAGIFGSDRESRAVLNIGGIANLSLLPMGGAVSGFDTGPGNGLLDAWIRRCTGAAFDADGAMAASGRVDQALLQTLLRDPFFTLPPPKSSGRDHFHLAWLEGHLAGRQIGAEDVQATLAALTVDSIADALRNSMPEAQRLLVCGGGVHNRHLMGGLIAALPDIQVESTAVHGVDPDAMEAMAFAWLARETLAGRPGNLSAVTGARGPRVLGGIFPA
ncbi:MAG: anhydro-N-acetylmuramic acid kinase [Lysobacteraceae bacterium]